ncbi:MAG: ATP-binding protein, partial [Actinomycetota bacterium]
AVLLYAISTHLFVSLAIALAERRSFGELSRDIAPATALNLLVNICLGLLLAASYIAARWTMVLFPIALAIFFVSYRALLRQLNEAARVEHLLDASRALAGSPSLEDALVAFLRAAHDITSTREARVIVETPKGTVWSAVRAGDVVASVQPLTDEPLKTLLGSVVLTRTHLIAKPGPAEHRELLGNLGAQSLLAVPLFDDDVVVGCLVAIDRVGADEFGDAEAHMLEALGHELVLTLDSYRLFEEIREERARFVSIFDASKEGICLLDESGNVRAWNPSLVRITGYAADVMIGKHWSDVVVLRTKEGKPIEGMAITALDADEELEVVRRDGASRWVAVVASAIDAAEEVGWVVQVRDVTAEHLAEAAKSDFLSTVSHELRTPLTTIKGSVAVLSRSPDDIDPDVLEKMVGLMRRGTDRLERLVMNLLYMSQLETEAELHLTIQDMDLAQTVRDRVAAIDGGPEQIGVRAPASLRVFADRHVMDLVVEHLLENALKFGNGSPIEVVLREVDRQAELVVSDGGAGIALIDQERIFDRFVRLGNVLTRETQGPGVGLFIVKRSAEAMRGSAWVESSPGRGASFHVTVPLARVDDERDQ